MISFSGTSPQIFTWLSPWAPSWLAPNIFLSVKPSGPTDLEIAMPLFPLPRPSILLWFSSHYRQIHYIILIFYLPPVGWKPRKGGNFCLFQSYCLCLVYYLTYRKHSVNIWINEWHGILCVYVRSKTKRKYWLSQSNKSHFKRNQEWEIP